MKRMTVQRQCILDELKKSRTHPTATELYECLRHTLPHISLGTVYRNLHRLAEKGLIRKLELGEGESRYDPDLREHYHVRCIRCGHIEDVVLENVLDVSTIRSQQGNFVIQGFHLEFIGYCSQCGQEIRGLNHEL
ncbi:transcriptional repressor [bacterium]|nr:transcriptional repressor [bacterium]